MIKDGYFNKEDFIKWIQNSLIPTLRSMYGPKHMVIIFDNVSIHTNSEVEAIIQAAGYSVRYLPSYSPDYNPIELTFVVLKAWIRRNYVYIQACYGGDFGTFLAATIWESNCDEFARKHFKYAADRLYIKQKKLDRVRKELRAPI